jgi:gliding motility-associated-like protein
MVGTAHAQYGVSTANQRNSCGALNNGSIDIVISDAASPTLTRVFGPVNFVDLPGPAGDHTHSLTGLPANPPPGFYIVIVQDASNVLVTTSFTIANSAGLSFASAPVLTDNSNCTGLPGDGSIQLNVTGGAGPSYSYVWSGPTPVGDVATAGGLSKGTYSVVINDNGSNCTLSAGPFVINDPGPLPFTISSADLSICEGEDLQLMIDDTDLNIGGSAITYEVFEGLTNVGTLPDWPATGDGAAQTLSVAGLGAGVHNLHVVAQAGVCGPIQSTNTLVVTVSPYPAIALGPGPGVCPGVTQATVGYSSTTATEYRLDFDAAAIAEGFINVGFSALAAAPAQIGIAVPGSADPGTYNASLTIRTATTGCTSSFPVAVTINVTPTISLDFTNAEVCSGGTSADLTYSGTTGTPDQYSINFDLAAEEEAFADVTDGALTGSPITISVPAGAATGIYNAMLTVRMASAGCVSPGIPITVEVKSTPAALLGASPEVCSGVTASTILYTISSGSPDQYSIDFDADAELQLFADVPLTTLQPAAVPITIPAGATPGLYNATLRFNDSGAGCFSESPITVRINDLPSISGVVDAVECFSATSASIAYGLTSNSPDLYSLDFNSTAEADGFVDITNAVLPASFIVVDIPATATASTYSAALTVSNSGTGCASSAAVPVQVIINPNANLTPGPDPLVCSGDATANLAYSGATTNADEYSLNFDVTAEGQLFADVNVTSVPASPIAIAVPPGASPGTYHAVLRVNSSTTGCFTDHAVSVTVAPKPTITLGAGPGVCPGVTLANLTYQATTADEYRLDFGAPALAEGFVNVGFTLLTSGPSQVGIVVPGAAGPGTYDITLTIRNSTTGCTSTFPVSVTVNEEPAIALDYTDPAVCFGGTSVALPFSNSSGPPDQYSIDFDGMAEAALFADVTNAALSGSPITIAIPGGAAVGIYNAVLTVRNTAVGCVSSDMPVTVSINPNPTITPAANTFVCIGTVIANLAYTATDAPDVYLIDFDAAGEAAGFVDVGLTSLPATPIGVAVPGAVLPGVYNASITASNSVTGCSSTAGSITVTAGVDVSLGVIDPVCMDTDALIPYSGVIGNPDEYSIDYDAAAEAAGFVDVTAALIPLHITVDVPNGIAGAFSAMLSVSNSTSGCASSQKPVSIVVGSSIAIGAAPVACVGSTSADIAFTTVTGGADHYTIDFDAVAEGVGFTDVVNASLTTSPLVIALPGAAPGAAYNFSLSVSSSVTGCGSLITPLIVNINALPSVIAGVDQTICTGATYLLAGSGVGGAASTGEWSIASQPAGGDGVLSSVLQTLDPSSISFSATAAGAYVLTLTTNNPAGGCAPVNDDVTITVTSVPILAAGQTKTICGNDELAHEILLTPPNVPANTIFNWPDPDGPGGASPGVNVPAGAAGTPHLTDRLINNALADIQVTYRITPSIGLCVGQPNNVAITVRPSPVLQMLQSKTICSGDAVNHEIRLVPANMPTGTVLSWPDPDGPLSGTSKLNVSADPAGIAHITDKLYNGSSSPVHVTYSIIATAPNGCRAVPRDVDVTVNPGAVVEAGIAQSICAGGKGILAGSGVGGLATAGTWMIVSGPAGGDGALGLTTPTTIADTVTFSATVAGNYTLRLTTDDPAGSCGPASGDVMITVRTLNDPACMAGTGTCATVVIVPTPSPATCSNSDGSIVFSILPFTPAINNTGVRIEIVGTGPTNQSISRTLFNEVTFTGLPFGRYDYTIEYGDPSCVKEGTVTVDRSGTVGVPVFSNPVDPVCFGVASGQVTIEVPGEAGNPLEWSVDGMTWTSFIAGNSVTGIPGGTNMISVRRNSGDLCASGGIVTLANPPQISTTLIPSPATCANNDGLISLSAVSGGTGQFTFKLNGAPVIIPVDNVLRGLPAGAYGLEVSDAAGCSRMFTTTVAFPGFVNHTVPVITPASCSGGGSDGIVSLNITDTGSYEYGVTTDPIAEPAVYGAVGGTQLTAGNLSNGIYAVWIKPVGSSRCITKISNVAVNGAFAVGFEATNTNIICLNDQATIELADISGASSLDYQYELVNTGTNATSTGIITSGQALAGFTIKDVEPGHYSIRLLQDQSSLLPACSTPVSSTPKALFVDGPVGVLDTLAVVRKISYPDLPTGSATVVISPSGKPTYELRLELVSPGIPGQEYVHDWMPVELDARTLKFEHTFTSLYSGGYEMRLIDAMGCEKTYEFSIAADMALSVPNIFTPNGDGVNEVFYVRNLPDNSRLIVTNRWGQQVYHSNAYSNDWTGGDVADGVYYYQLELPSESITGWVEIHRGL